MPEELLTHEEKKETLADAFMSFFDEIHKDSYEKGKKEGRKEGLIWGIVIGVILQGIVTVFL